MTNLPEHAERLRIYTGEADRFEGRLLHEAIVHEAKRQGLSGATVVRGIMGYGAHSLVHSSKILRLSEDLSMIVEIVDTPEKIEAFLPILDRMMQEGLVTREPVDIVFHRR